MWVSFALGVSAIDILANKRLAKTREINSVGTFGRCLILMITLYGPLVGCCATQNDHLRPVGKILNEMQHLLTQGILSAPALLARLYPYVLVIAVFITFLVWNGGVVLGDKDHHIVIPHYPQAFYFLIFSAGFAAPVVLDVDNLVKTIKRAVMDWRIRCVLG
jgi:hypothetical protein